MQSKRFSKNDWVLLGLKVLASSGAEAVTIDNLCKNAKKTKGSFYFHFDSIESFLISVTTEWKEAYTSKITQNDTQSNRLDLLNQLAARIDLDLETGIRQLALQHDQVQEVVMQADNERIEWLARLYEKSGKYDKDTALSLATIEIAAFTGFKLIKPDMQPQQARELYESFLKLTSRA